MTEDKTVKECSCSSETPKVEAPVEITKVETPEVKKADEIPQYVKDLQTNFTKLQTDYANMSGQLEKIKGLEKEIGVRDKPTTPVSNPETNTELTLEQIAQKIPKHLKEYGKFEFIIPYDRLRELAVAEVQTPNGLREAYRNNMETRKLITEAYTLSGTHSRTDQSSDVKVVPGAVDSAPIRQFTDYKVVAQGADSHTFYKKTLPAVLSQTAGTTATQAAMTMTAAAVTPSTISGVYFKVNSDDIENVPYNLTQEIVSASAMLAVDFENDDILNAVSKEGTLTPGSWIRGDTGATITHSDTASVTLDPTGVGTAKQYLANQGYLRGGVRPVFCLHPTQFLQLVEDSEVTNYTQFAIPGITTELSMDRFYGVDLVQTNSIEQKDNTTTDSYNGLMFIPGHSYGSASKRDVTVKFHEYGEDNQIRVNTNWRFKSGVIDASSIVRISTSP